MEIISKSSLSTGKAKEKIKNAVYAYLQKEKGKYIIPLRRRIPLYLSGGPGIGKTEAAHQAAEELNIGFVSFSLTHHTRNTLLGLPVIGEMDGYRYTEYTMSEIIAKVCREVAGGHKEGILLLDEFNCVSETIMPVMLEFLQTGRIGMHSLPEGWILVLCGNPTEYNKSARVFDAAVMDRVRCIEMAAEYEDFDRYAAENDLHPVIREFLSKHKESLYYVSERGHDRNNPGMQEVVTPRGWENLSWTLKGYESSGLEVDEELVHEFIKSEKTAYDFYRYYFMNIQSFSNKDVEKILKGEDIGEYISMISKKPLSFSWTVADYLAAYICNEAKENENRTDPVKGYGNISDMISKAIRFAENLPEGGKLQESIFLKLNGSKEVAKVLIRVRNEEYLNISRRMYGMTAAGRTA